MTDHAAHDYLRWCTDRLRTEDQMRDRLPLVRLVREDGKSA